MNFFISKNKNNKNIITEEKELKNGEKRSITKNIESNRGLTRERNKKYKHAKTKNRYKYEKALKKQRGMKRNLLSKDKPYQGETTGIKKNVIRSTTLFP